MTELVPSEPARSSHSRHDFSSAGMQHGRLESAGSFTKGSNFGNELNELLATPIAGSHEKADAADGGSTTAHGA